MDNQQVISLTWLAGFTNGDGCISIAKRTRNKGRVNYKPYVTFSNNDPELIEEISSILKSVNVGHYVSWNKKKSSLGNNIVGAVNVFGFLRCEKLLDILTPHLRGSKRKQAELASEWIKYRLTNGGNSKHYSYSEYDDAVYEKMAFMKRELTSETIRAGYTKV